MRRCSFTSVTDEGIHSPILHRRWRRKQRRRCRWRRQRHTRSKGKLHELDPFPSVFPSKTAGMAAGGENKVRGWLGYRELFMLRRLGKRTAPTQSPPQYGPHEPSEDEPMSRNV